MQSVDHSVQVMKDLGVILTDAMKVATTGVGIGSLKTLYDIISAGKDLVKQAPVALPELEHMDAESAQAISAAAYQLVKSAIGSFTASAV